VLRRLKLRQIKLLLVRVTDCETVAMTGGKDIITATQATMQTLDVMKDSLTKDSDTITVTATGPVTFGTVTNVESINLDFCAQLATTLSSNNTKPVGGDLALSVDAKVEVAGIEVDGATTVSLTENIK
jgi:hypothetical protein